MDFRPTPMSNVRRWGIREWIKQSILIPFLDSRLLANYWAFWASFVLRVRKPLIIGVTGSAGKTTTVTLIAAVLGHLEGKRTLGSIGHTMRNMNDDNGLPLTILRYEHWPDLRQKFVAALFLPFRAIRLAASNGYPKVLVLEYGTHNHGHLHRLVRLAPPSIGVVTTIGPAHLDRLKTMSGIVNEKSAIVSSVPATGLVVLGADHDYVGDLQKRSRCQVITVPGRGFELARAIALVVGRHLGLSEEAIASAINAAPPIKGRLNQFEIAGMTVIDDSYNANPISMRLGLDTLYEKSAPSSRRVAVLGAMAELGEDAATYHQEIGQYAKLKAEFVVGIGELARLYQPDRWFATSDECAVHLNDLLRQDDCILVKGSASAKTSAIVQRLRNAPPEWATRENL